MTSKDILITYSGDKYTQEQVDKVSVWIHDSVLTKNSKGLIKPSLSYINDITNGEGTRENPFVYAYDDFKKFADVAKFNGYKEAFSYENDSSFKIDEKFLPKDRSYYFFKYIYKYKKWKRGNSDFDNFWNWNDMISHLKSIKQLGYSTNKYDTHKHLLDLDEDGLEQSILNYYKELWKLIEPKTELKISKGDKAELTMLLLGKYQKIKGDIIEGTSKRLFFLSENSYKVYDEYGEKKDGYINYKDPVRFLLEDKNASESKIKIPVQDYKAPGEYTLGAIKYNNFKIINK